MRIAIIIEQVNRRGGQERVVAELAERLSRYHEVHLFCFDADDIKGERLTVHLLWRPTHSSTGLALWLLLDSLLCLRDPHFDAIISQGGNSLMQTHVLLHNAHGLRLRALRSPEARAHVPSLFRRTFLLLRAWFFLHFEGRAVRRCRGRVMVVSDFLKPYVLQQHRLSAEEVHVTPNGVDHSTFHPGLKEQYRQAVREEMGLPQDALVILSLGGRWSEKGVPTLVEALGAMKDRQAHLVIVGKGDVGSYTRLAAQHGVEARVHFRAATAQPQRYFGMADCFGLLNPAEPFGLVLAEAAASGLALVATGAGAGEYLVEDGVSGFRVTQDAAQVADRLDRLSSDRGLLAAMMEQAHEKSLALSWDRQAAQVRALLEER